MSEKTTRKTLHLLPGALPTCMSRPGASLTRSRSSSTRFAGLQSPDLFLQPSHPRILVFVSPRINLLDFLPSLLQCEAVLNGVRVRKILCKNLLLQLFVPGLIKNSIPSCFTDIVSLPHTPLCLFLHQRKPLGKTTWGIFCINLNLAAA